MLIELSIQPEWRWKGEHAFCFSLKSLIEMGLSFFALCFVHLHHRYSCVDFACCSMHAHLFTLVFAMHTHSHKQRRLNKKKYYRSFFMKCRTTTIDNSTKKKKKKKNSKYKDEQKTGQTTSFPKTKIEIWETPNEAIEKTENRKQ